MPSIAKMIIREVKDFGSNKLLELSCICDDDMMAAYATSHEDKLFTQYSPWGEIKLNQPPGFCLGEVGDAFYVMIMKREDAGEFPGCYAKCDARCVSVTDFGDGMAKTLEVCTGWATDKEKWRYAVENFNWKMSVDNPPVFNDLKPGADDLVIAFYPADKFDRDATIAAAHEK